MPKFKTRSAWYLKNMNDDVKNEVRKKAEELNVAAWVIVETILENTFNIGENDIDVAKWLGINKNNARIGKPYKKSTTK